MKDIFEKFPHEIIAKVFSLLNGIDLYSISLVNKNLLTHTKDGLVWKLACQNEFKRVIINEWLSHESTSSLNQGHVQWRNLYSKLRNSISYFCQDEKCVSCNAPKLDNGLARYRIVPDEESHFGKALHLQNIWLFEINTNITVAPGTYDILIRVKCEKKHQGLGGLRFCTEVLNKKKKTKEIYTCSPQKAVYHQLASRNEWVELMLSYVITIPERKNNTEKKYKLAFNISEEKKYMKSGLLLDYVRCRPHVEDKLPHFSRMISPVSLMHGILSTGTTSSVRQIRRVRGWIG
ncbi:6951_t:CDS:2 [Ambispora gerdemannii]|uniref:6951_t:CDS:1 n=1 Tax=Ambispora gerdemannii TaxID=144530 RepID=A0A9N9CEF0_9GLOM|nr:6951_t:CDS:2 [Ambispora gerdemannii]